MVERAGVIGTDNCFCVDNIALITLMRCNSNVNDRVKINTQAYRKERLPSLQCHQHAHLLAMCQSNNVHTVNVCEYALRDSSSGGKCIVKF